MLQVSLLLLLATVHYSSAANHGSILLVSSPEVNGKLPVRLHSNWGDVQSLLPSAEKDISWITTSKFTIDDIHDRKLDNFLESNKNAVLFPVVLGNIKMKESAVRDVQSVDEAFRIFKEDVSNNRPVVLISKQVQRTVRQDTSSKGKIMLSRMNVVVTNRTGSTSTIKFVPKPGTIPMEFADGVVQVEFESKDVPEAAIFKATFFQQSGFWYLNESFLTIGQHLPLPMYHYACSSHWNMRTPMNYSYVCQSTYFRPISGNVSEDITYLSVVITDMRLQPFNYIDHFGRPSDCTCYLTSPMWMCLFFILIFGYFVSMAVSSMSKIEGPTKFPNAQSKMISVPTENR